MKKFMTYVVVAIVILGLVGSFVLTGLTRNRPSSQTPQGPQGDPYTNGPTEAPPTN